MTPPTETEINARIEVLAKQMRARGLVHSDMQAREQAKDIIMGEIKYQASFEAAKDDPNINPQQRKSTISAEDMKAAGGMLSGDEFPKGMSLADALKGRKTTK